MNKNRAMLQAPFFHFGALWVFLGGVILLISSNTRDSKGVAIMGLLYIVTGLLLILVKSIWAIKNKDFLEKEMKKNK